MWNERKKSFEMEPPGHPSQKLKDRVLLAQAIAELRRSGYDSLRQIECEVRDGVLMLTGRVPSYYLKQVAQTLVQFRLPNVEIRNELEVLVHWPVESAVVGAEEPTFA